MKTRQWRNRKITNNGKQTKDKNSGRDRVKVGKKRQIAQQLHRSERDLREHRLSSEYLVRTRSR